MHLSVQVYDDSVWVADLFKSVLLPSCGWEGLVRLQVHGPLCEEHVESILASMSWAAHRVGWMQLCEVRTPRWKI